MRYAYADPPYFGMDGYYGHFHGDDGLCWDELSTHERLIKDRLSEFDGWALSLTSTTLQAILPLCRGGVRVAAWVKPFASFKPGVNPGYCWEPVIFYGARRQRSRTEPTVRDFLAEPITLQRGLVGAKPEAFCRWIANLLGVTEEDELIDLFPGTGVMGRTLAQGTLPY